MGDRKRVGIGMSYRPARPYRLAETIPGILKSFKMPSRLHVYWHAISPVYFSSFYLKRHSREMNICSEVLEISALCMYEYTIFIIGLLM
jgi:hypothetical protein